MTTPSALLALVLAIACSLLHAAGDYASVVPGATIVFPADRGSHPAYRIEWWYVTGQLDTANGPVGFQATFFRLRNRDAEGNPSRFAPSQLLFAHAALSDPRHAKLRHDQRIARAMPTLAEASERETKVFIDDWSLERSGEGYRARIPAEGFALDLTLTPTQPPLLQGETGFSRKGPGQGAASYYYSEPQLVVTGSVTAGEERIEAKGVAWLDHEWSSEYLAKGAVGWDWAGLNLESGGALMAFRLRDGAGNTVWAGGTLRAPGAKPRAFTKDEVRFTPLRTWKSPRSNVTWPVAMAFSVAGEEWRVEPLMDDQELDARASTGTLYWEGAVRATGPGGARARGYLELTGYAEPVRF
jgi:predicted secreted hydrolase